MEDLLNVIDNSFSIGTDRRLQYKFNGKVGIEAKDFKRSELVTHFKRRRDALINEKRKLLEDDFNDKNEGWMDWDDFTRCKARKWVNENCKNQLMLSEWLLDRPYDLETEWTCVLCPEGRRCLIVSKNGCTRAYQKNGMLAAKFTSVLPNGSPSTRTNSSEMVILDCIWRGKTKQLFLLDVLYWRNQTLLDCDAQFRFYWLKSKVAELKLEKQDDKMQPLFLPPCCAFSQLGHHLEENNPADVDGILFYHNQAPYISGQTPLVGWLKPFMLTERFGLAVSPQYAALRPDNYTNLEQWVAEHSHSHVRNHKSGRRRRSKNKTNEKMDQSDNSTVSISEMEEAPIEVN